MEGCQEDGADFAAIYRFTAHYRISAKTGEGIEEAVKQVVKEVRELMQVIFSLLSHYTGIRPTASGDS